MLKTSSSENENEELTSYTQINYKYMKGNVKRPFYIKMVVKGTICICCSVALLRIQLAYQILGFFTI